jgi:hypothetical protein
LHYAFVGGASIHTSFVTSDIPQSRANQIRLNKQSATAGQAEATCPGSGF